MYKAEPALDELMDYSQLGPSRWKATYRGFVTLSAEGLSPKKAQFNREAAFDVLMANLIRTSHRPLKSGPDVVVQEERPSPGTEMARRPEPYSVGTQPRSDLRKRQIESRKRATATKPRKQTIRSKYAEYAMRPANEYAVSSTSHREPRAGITGSSG